MPKTHSQIGFAFILNLLFTILEFIGGFLTNSIAIYSNAVHDLGDTISLGTSYGLERYSKRQKGKTFTYGYGRFSLLAALLNGLVLVGGSAVILLEAIPRLMHPGQLNVEGMIWLAIIGVSVNGMAALRIKTGTTMNAQVVRLHLIEDILSWSAILIVALTLLIRDIPILDPILSIGITLFILWNVVRNLRETFRLFLQGKPRGLDLDKMKRAIIDIDGVEAVHDMHLWSMDGENHVLTLHVVAQKSTSAKRQFDIKCCIRGLLQKYANIHVTIEMETKGEKCDTQKVC